MRKSADIVIERPSYHKRTAVKGFTKRAMEGEAMNKVGGYDTYVNNYQNYVGQSKELRDNKIAGRTGRISAISSLPEITAWCWKAGQTGS